MKNLEVTEFWRYICEDLGYRFFSGTACGGLKSLYDNMDPMIMHYVPAVNERVALGISTGVAISGDKCGVLMHVKNVKDVLNLLKFNRSYKLPILFIVYEDEDSRLNSINNMLIDSFYLNFDTLRKDLTKLEKNTILKGKPGMIVIDKGVL